MLNGAISMSRLAIKLTCEHLEPDPSGMIHLPERPGLGIRPDPLAIRKSLVDTKLRVNGQAINRTPAV